MGSFPFDVAIGTLQAMTSIAFVVAIWIGLHRMRELEEDLTQAKRSLRLLSDRLDTLAQKRSGDTVATPMPSPFPDPPTGFRLNCPNCAKLGFVASDKPGWDLQCIHCGHHRVYPPLR